MSGNIDVIEFWNDQLFELLTLEKEIYFTQLIQYEHHLLIQRPLNQKGKPMMISDGMPITVYFHDDKQGLCTFESRIYHDQNGQMVINKPRADAIKTAQRRLFFRVPVALEMNLVFPPIKKSEDVKEINMYTYDISGGGTSFLFKEKVAREGDLAVGNIYFEMNGYEQNVTFNCRVVNVVKLQPHLFKISLEFIEMNEAVRSDIIKFCLYKQIELRNKVRNE